MISLVSQTHKICWALFFARKLGEPFSYHCSMLSIFHHLRVFFPSCYAYLLFTFGRYVSDPQLGAANMALAAESTGNANFIYGQKVVSIDKSKCGTSVTGVTLEDGSQVSAPIVVNVGGPHSNQLTRLAYEGADVENDMKVSTKALRQEVGYLPGMGYGSEDAPGPVVIDPDTGCYMRPEVGDKVLVGGVEPECDTLHFVDNPDDCNMCLSEEHTNFTYRAALRMPSLPVLLPSYGPAASPLQPRLGSRRTTRSIPSNIGAQATHIGSYLHATSHSRLRRWLHYPRLLPWVGAHLLVNMAL